MTALTLSNVTYRYPKAVSNVIESLTCTFDFGQLYAIAGPSGSGKTTILSLLSGVYSPISGEILYENTNIKNIEGHIYRRQCVSTIYQKLNLISYLTVSENIELCLDINGFTGNRNDYINNILNQVHLDTSFSHRLPKKLSGGECQRVAIARCLTNDSKVILADEPTGNLDADNANAIITLFQEIAHKQNKCVIMVCHDVTLIDRVDKVYNLRGGTFI